MAKKSCEENMKAKKPGKKPDAEYDGKKVSIRPKRPTRGVPREVEEGRKTQSRSKQKR